MSKKGKIYLASFFIAFVWGFVAGGWIGVFTVLLIVGFVSACTNPQTMWKQKQEEFQYADSELVPARRGDPTRPDE